MKPVPRGWPLASIAFAIMLLPQLTLAQGSGGGSIGNDDKSVSGSRPERSVEPSSAPSHRSKPAAEEPRSSARRGGGGGGGGGGAGSFDGAWAVVSVGCGGSSTSAVVVTSGRIIGEGLSGRVSPGGAASSVGHYNGVTVVSSGHVSGRSGSGTFRRSDGCSGTWTSTKQ